MKFTKEELLNCAIYALMYMQEVDGIRFLTIEPEQIEDAHTLGTDAFFYAAINKTFIDNNIQKLQPEPFEKGSDRYDYYNEYSETLDGDEPNWDVTWQIQVQKVSKMFSEHYDGQSFIGMGDLLFPIGHVEEMPSIKEVFCFFVATPKSLQATMIRLIHTAIILDARAASGCLYRRGINCAVHEVEGKWIF